MCNCHGVLGAGCIEGEGDCDNDEQCTEVTCDDILTTALINISSGSPMWRQQLQGADHQDVPGAWESAHGRRDIQKK